MRADFLVYILTISTDLLIYLLFIYYIYLLFICYIYLLYLLYLFIYVARS